MRGEITPEQLTSFLFYTEFVVQSALATCEQLANMQGAVGSSERVMQLLRRRPEGAASPGKLRLASFTGQIDFVNVSFSYPLQSTPTLEGINLTLKPGTVTALVGPSGNPRWLSHRLLLMVLWRYL